ncbi:MAG: hypothetical protein HFH12_04300 [Dorea sp.]|nr:hypothetical protein [Dorea sp.]
MNKEIGKSSFAFSHMPKLSAKARAGGTVTMHEYYRFRAYFIFVSGRGFC